MDTLPDHLIDYIYEQKHILEMKDICNEFLYIQNEERDMRLEYIGQLYLEYKEDDGIFYFQPDKIMELLTILRNEGETDDAHLSDVANYIINKNTQCDWLSCNSMIIDEEFYMNNDWLTIDWFFKHHPCADKTISL